MNTSNTSKFAKAMDFFCTVRQFTRSAAFTVLMGAFLLSGCATTGGINEQSDKSLGAVTNSQNSDSTITAEEHESNPIRCGVIGAIIGGAIGIAAAVPTCTNFVTSGLCPEAVLLMAGTMAIVGNAVGTLICREQVNHP